MTLETSKSDFEKRSRSIKRIGLWIRRLISVLAFGVIIYLFWPLLGELKNVAELIKQAGWIWLASAIGVQFISYGFLARLNQLLLSPFEGKIGFWRLMAVLPVMAFIEVALPSAGLSGFVLRARLLRKSGYSVEASSFTLVLETIYIGLIMTAASFAGVWYLFNSGGMHLSQLVGLIVFGIFLVGAGILFYKFASDKHRGLVWVGRLGSQWNRVLHALGRPQISLEGLVLRTNRFYDGFERMRSVSVISLLALAVGRVILDVITLGLCFMAFHYFVPIGILLTGYGLILVLSGLAALPGGLGLADVSLAVIFNRLGAPGPVSVAAALCYRLVAFWFVRFAGFISWQVLESQGV